MAHRESTRPVALITGAAGGLGLIVTEVFLDAGYCVLAVDRNVKQLCASDDCLVMKADLSSRSAAEAVVDETVNKWGPVHALAHLVGVFAEGGPVEDTSGETWEAMLNGNLRTAANMLRVVIPGMRKQGRGSITVIGSSTVTHPVVTWSAFNASVSGLCTLVQTTAAELRDNGITVNALLPTTIATPQLRSWFGEGDAQQMGQPTLFGISSAVAGVGTWPGC